MKDERLLKGEPIASGIVEGEILVSKDPINFYMVSPEKGTIIEQDHALTDKVIAKKIIVFPIDKGSSVVQMDGLYQMSKFDNKPAGFIVLDLSTVLVSNAIIMDIPLIRVDQQTYDKFCEGQRSENGRRLWRNNDPGVKNALKKERIAMTPNQITMLIILIAYMAVVLAVGLYASRRVKGSEDFLLAAGVPWACLSWWVLCVLPSWAAATSSEPLQMAIIRDCPA